jgi:Trk K+ transport system NAD-binding subunit
LAHTIVCGLGRIGWPVLEYLKAANWSVVAIDQEIAVDDPRLAGIRLLRGDFRDPRLLQEAGLAEAQGVLLLANDDLNNLAASLDIRQLRADVRIVVRLFNENLLRKLGETITNVVALSSSRLGAPLLASAALTGDLLARFTADQQTWQISSITIDPQSSLAGQSWSQVRQRFPGLERISNPSPASVPIPHPLPLREGEQLIVAGTPAALDPLRLAAQTEEPLALRWAGQLRRWLRTAWRTFWEIEWPVRYAALGLFSVVLLGSLVFRFAHVRPTWPKALLYTLNIMVTSADLKTSQDAEPWEEMFISLLKFAGLFLTAAFTALMTNYLVRARLGGALAARRIPEAGHIVLCGLGTVGIRVVEQLRAAGAAVVVIERAEGTRFLAAARQQGATVLLGDGTLLTTLARARAGTARALIAATSSDLANVEMALLARELNAKLRVVLRLDDGALAGSLRQTANIRYALGLPQLIAPAFVAPLFGDRVVALFWLEGTLQAILELETEPKKARLESVKSEFKQGALQVQWIPFRENQRGLAILPIDQVAHFLAVHGGQAVPSR